ncbi:MAG: hypothetical protein ACSHW2_02835, partial [Parasphingopyxis sp.]
FFHSNDDADGNGWNRRAVVDGLAGNPTDYDDTAYAVRYRPGTRRVESLEVSLTPDGGARLLVEPAGPDFHMSGLGYTHPVWGHGMDHGDSETAYDSIEAAAAEPRDPLHWHIQAFVRATLTLNGMQHHGHGILEQLLIGPHAPSGFTELLDPAS